MKKPITVMRNELISMVQCLEPDAVEVLHMQAARLVAGREQYGELRLDTDRRDWRQQTAEELVDGLSYLTMEILKMRRSGR